MVVLDATIVTVALPSMRRALHFSTVDLQWVISAYTLAFGGLLLLKKSFAQMSDSQISSAA